MAKPEMDILVEMLEPELRAKRRDAPKKAKSKATAKPKRKAWGKPLEISGQRWELVTVPEHAVEYGQTVFAENVIEVNEGPEGSMQDTLIHEVLHAIMESSGFRWDLRNLKPRMSAKQRELLEELICRRLTPAIITTFRGAGWLRLPSKPGRHKG